MDWIPDNEAAHAFKLNKFITFASANIAALGVTAPKLLALTTAAATYNTKKTARDNYNNQGPGIFQGLRDAKEALDALWRTSAGEINARQETTDEQRANLGITIADDIQTAPTVPGTFPVILKIDANARLTHIIHWRDSGTPDSKRKPPGVKHAILLLTIGGPTPTGPDQMQTIASDSATPYLYEFAEADAGKVAHWALCWETTDGNRSACGPVMSWTIPG